MIPHVVAVCIEPSVEMAKSIFEQVSWTWEINFEIKMEKPRENFLISLIIDDNAKWVLRMSVG